MSIIKDYKWNRKNFHIEFFETANEVVEKSRQREYTDGRFHNIPEEKLTEWSGIKSWDDALEMLRIGYQPTVAELQEAFKMSKCGQGKRFSFQNTIQGFAPVVPLALKGVPNCMINMQAKPIKTKVIDVYYDMTTACRIESDDIIRAGQTLLKAIIDFEKQGYRFNLYACQSYNDSSCDMMVVKVKSSSQPLDLKRVSFALAHTAFFRVIGFDWYGKCPGATYRYEYGHGLGYDYNEKQLNEMAQQLFGKQAVYFSAAKIVEADSEHVKEVLANVNSKN